MDIAIFKQEIEKQVSNQETMNSLLEITFKGLTPELAKRALLEGMMRGLQFQNFMVKDVYAIPFTLTNERKEKILSYSLVTSIDYARKIGARSGVVGKSEPLYEEKDGQLIACTVTVKKRVLGSSDNYIGDYTAKVYFGEYATGKNLWVSKPRTMIAKVAEMHALRMACPDEMYQLYLEEERQQDVVRLEEREEQAQIAVNTDKSRLEATTTLEELQKIWQGLSPESKISLAQVKDDLKKKYATG